MEAKKRFPWLELVIILSILGLLAIIVIQEFRADVERARIQEEIKDKEIRSGEGASSTDERPFLFLLDAQNVLHSVSNTAVLVTEC